jgi:hypothetical protein
MNGDLESKKKITIEKLESARQNYRTVQIGLAKIREGAEEIDKNVQQILTDVDKSLEVFHHIPDQVSIQPSTGYSTFVNSSSLVSDQIYDHSVRLKQTLEPLAQMTWSVATSAFSGATASSDLAFTAYETGVSVLASSLGSRGLREAVEKAKMPNPITERKALGARLNSIEPRLYEKFEGMWQTLTDTTKRDRFRQAAHSMREVISELLQVLAPEEQVKQAKWWKPETESKKPTQRQRVKYAIIGLAEQPLLSDEDIDLIEALMNDARNRYEDLNEIAHARNQETEDLFPLLESYISTCQRIINDILKLRDEHFRASLD